MIKSARFVVRMVKNGKLRVTVGQMEATIDFSIVTGNSWAGKVSS